ncbi:hypothetical protein H072_9575 [Dactylellina haptotyla CBS 200.50]|uniref:DNA-(apurinic or apyrimidinic site) endonuclease 2 n=1 Tax=Dactylellina haptotyla (strain CBS 200.50) TaxID=1284197 RepID=S8BCD9_DACHA|nr:hypothetical protein H072_9575 [Dactylellina haptotyla CBS 200.50]
MEGQPQFREADIFGNLYNGQAMFDILEADVVCFQELKIQSKDLRDDMVLIPGWDSYFTFPKHKKGYSGVAIYTRQSKISPIKAEEGITGHLQPTNAARNISYRDLPDDQQIGGYPSIDKDDGVILDSEGRGLVVDFGLFVLIGTYCPVGREEEARQDFRMAWLTALEERIRNLTKMGRRVVTVGDLNISPEPIDSADAWEMQKRTGPDSKETAEWKDAPAKRLLRGLCEPSEDAVMVDVVRQFFPDRVAMYTHWETKINARPGNYASSSMKRWFESADIQNGLHGSDHCPVYAVLKPEIEIDGERRVSLDLVNPPGVFVNGERKIESPPPPKLSARLIPQFSGRRSIKDMFQTKSTLSTFKSTVDNLTLEPTMSNTIEKKPREALRFPAEDIVLPSTQLVSSYQTSKRTLSVSSTADRLEISDTTAQPSPKKAKTTFLGTGGKRNPVGSTTSTGSQQSLKSFFQPKPAKVVRPEESKPEDGAPEIESQSTAASSEPRDPSPVELGLPSKEEEKFIDPFETRDSWNKLFTKRPTPLCDGHNEPAKMMQTKKPGVNNGRSFWMCARYASSHPAN